MKKGLNAELVPPIKVHFFGRQQPISVDVSRLYTFKDFKDLMRILTFIEPQNQKLIINGKIVTWQDNTPINDDNLNYKDKIVLASAKKNKIDDYKKQQKTKKTQIKMKHLKLVSSFDKLLLKQDKFNKIFNSMLTYQVLIQIVPKLIDIDVIKKNQRTIFTKKGQFKFILRELRQCKLDPQKQKDDYPESQQPELKRKVPNQLSQTVWKRIQAIVIKMMIDFPLDIKEQIIQPKQTYDKRIFEQLKAMGYYEKKIIQALNRGCNNYYDTLTTVASDFDEKDFQITNQVDDCDQVFLYQWFTTQASKIWRVRIHLDPSELDILLNSLKYRCPPLYQMILRHRKYVIHLITSRPIPIPMKKLPPLPKKQEQKKDENQKEEDKKEEDKKQEEQKEEKKDEKKEDQKDEKKGQKQKKSQQKSK